MCRLWLVVACLVLTAWPALAQPQPRRGYVTPKGAYVPPGWQSKPNASPYDNYGTRGNVNPFTGKPGTRDPYAYRAPRQR